LIEALRSRLPEGSWFVSGKCEALAVNIPYTPFVSAFASLARQLAQLPADEIDRWRTRVAATLGANLGVIVEAVPALRALVGETPEVAPAGARATAGRVRLAFELFLSALAELGRPLVLFLDDLQWADPDSLALIQGMVASSGEHHLLLIGAFRAEDVAGCPPLASLLDASVGGGTATRAIALAPLGLASLTELCAHLFACPEERAQPLASLILRKTAGNPFFAQRFLNHLQNEGLLTFAPTEAAWSWDLARSETARATDNVIDMMIEQVARLPERTRRLLEVGACLRARIDSPLLAAVTGAAPEEIEPSLRPALRDGLLVQLMASETSARTRAYRFAHERISAAVLAQLDADARKRLHLAIGRCMMAAQPGRQAGAGEPASEHLFDLVEQLNRGADLMDNPAERTRLGELNLRAAECAKRAGSLLPALAYARRGIDVLPGEDAWQQHHGLCLALYRLAAECAFLTDDVASGEALFATALTRPAGRMERVELQLLRATIESGRGDLRGSITWAREGLGLLGLDVPADPQAALPAEVARLRAELADAGPLHRLLELSPMRDVRMEAAMCLFQRILVPAVLFDRPLWAFIAARMVGLSLQHGNTAASACGYVNLGIHIADTPGDEDFGEALARVGLELGRRDPQIEGWVLTSFTTMSNQWRTAWRAQLPMLRRAAVAGLECGDFQMAGIARISLSAMTFHSGVELPVVSTECHETMRMMRRTGQKVLFTTPSLYHEVSQRLQCPPAGRPVLLPVPPPDAYPSSILLPVYLRDVSGIAPRFPELLAKWEEHSSIRASFGAVWISFYGALLAVQILEREATDQPERLREGLLQNQRRLQAWAVRCPQNFGHRADLVSAEIARIDGHTAEALLLYEQAIEGASRERFVNEEALAHELAARCRLASGLARTAADALLSAREGYARWGATAKVAALDEEFPQLGSSRRALDLIATRPPAPDGGQPNLDVYSLLKAAEAISSEVELDRLLEKLIAVSLEVAGARRGALVLAEAQRLTVRAVGEVAAPVALGRTELWAAEHMPRTLIEHVFRSRETVALADASGGASFYDDPYVRAGHGKAILAVPIVRQASTLGVLYLENDLASYGFSPDKVRIVTLLTSQIAIALENGRLFHGLKAEINERTLTESRIRFLAEASSVLAQSLDYHTTLAQAARLAVPVLADLCTIDVLERGGELTPVAAAHVNPAKAALLKELRKDFPVVALAQLPAYQAIQRGEPVMNPDVTDEQLAAVVTNPRHLAILRELGIRSYLAVPLIARGHVLGAFTLGSATAARTHGPQQVALAQELARRAAVLIDNARLYQAAQEALRLRDEFLTVASHELNTPIAALRLVVESLNPGVPPPAGSNLARALGVIDRQTARLAALVAEMLDVSGSRSNELCGGPRRLDLGVVVEELIDDLHTTLERARCPLSLALVEGVVGNWPRVAIERIATNLLSNAIKFGAGAPIDVTLESRDGRAWLSIRDHGIGIAPEQLPRIFECFGRGVPVENYGGLGLGLYIVQQLVSSLEGSVEVTSKAGEGATFTVVLPLAPAT
jgi:predicted ATPase/signal transduction histidine kinase